MTRKKIASSARTKSHFLILYQKNYFVHISQRIYYIKENIDDLRKKIMPLALITGSGKRIGRGLALRFARDGWDVIIHYNTSEESAKTTQKEILDQGRQSFLIKSDIRDEEQVISSFKDAVDKIGVPNVLINNAAIFPPQTPIKELEAEQWDDAMNINLRSAFFFSRIFAQYAKENSRIINISSLGGIKIWKQRIPYNVSKAGLLQLTKALAKELAPSIAVNSICPGAIMIENEPSENDKFLVSQSKIPMRRHGNVDDIYDAAYFFATCSKYITGQILCIDGGLSL
jgi:NAD(P)-dependent dehydrogenase (short-subunit alcohol dehydrogenase family)